MESPVAADGARIEAIDAARTMAIVGMFVVHLSGVAANRWWFLHWATGYSAGGFALLAGVSMGLTRRTSRPGWRPWLIQAARSALLFALGVWLAAISTGPIVILCVYALLFLVLRPFRRLSGPALLAIGLTLTVVSPILAWWLRRDVLDPSLLPGLSVDWGLLGGPDPVPSVLRTLFVDGTYPILTWLPLALVGWGAQRSGLLAPARIGRLTAVAAAVLVLGFGLSAALEATTHSRAELIATRPDTVTDIVTDTLTLTGTGTGTDTGTDTDTVRRVGGKPVVVIQASSPFDEGLGTPNTVEAKGLLTAGHHTGTTFELWQILGVTAGVLAGFSILARLGSAGRRLVRVAGWPGRIPLTVYSAHIVVGWQLDRHHIGVGLGPAGQAAVLVAYIVGAFVLGFLLRHHRGPLEWILNRASTLVDTPIPSPDSGLDPNSDPVETASAQAASLNLRWPPESLNHQREEAGER